MNEIWKIKNEGGSPLDARVEIEDGVLIIHSRSGGPARNTQYQDALKLILSRLSGHSNEAISRVILDSNRVQKLPVSDRILAERSDFANVPLKELLNQIRRKMRDFNKPENAKKHGNQTKRLRIESPLGQREIVRIVRAQLQENVEPIVSSDPGTSGETMTDEDRKFTEGAPRRTWHLRRERAAGLATKKKAEFAKEHGKLSCEQCGLDPIRRYGQEAGDACIEVHHTIPVAEMEPNHETELVDLKCLCANCHRVLHKEMRLKKNS